MIGANNSSVNFKTDIINLTVNVSGLGVNWNGNRILNGNEVLSAALDIAGIFDPSGLADAANTVLLASRGDYFGAAQSAFLYCLLVI